MKVLVACEYSGAVRDAFREREAMRRGRVISSPATPQARTTKVTCSVSLLWGGT